MDTAHTTSQPIPQTPGTERSKPKRPTALQNGSDSTTEPPTSIKSPELMASNTMPETTPNENEPPSKPIQSPSSSNQEFDPERNTGAEQEKTDQSKPVRPSAVQKASNEESNTGSEQLQTPDEHKEKIEQSTPQPCRPRNYARFASHSATRTCQCFTKYHPCISPS